MAVSFDPNVTNLSLDLFFNDETLNIFSDASTKKYFDTMSACSGAVAVCKNDIVDQLYEVNSLCTVPAAELRGIRNSLTIALANRNKYRVINLFSDSQIALFGLRDWIYRWYYNPTEEQFYLRNHVVKNQNIMIECFLLLEELRRTNIVNLFHQSAHVEGNYNAIREALVKFKKFNGITGKVDYNFIRYISIWNSHVDNNSRSIIRRTNTIDNDYIDPIEFTAKLNSTLHINRYD